MFGFKSLGRSLRYDIIEQEDRDDFTKRVSEPRMKHRRSGLWLHISLLLNAFLIFVILGATALRYSVERPYSWNWSLKRVNTPSPLLERFNFELEDIVVNGSVFNIDHTIFQQPPSPAVDEAWKRISEIKIIAITGDDLEGLGRDPNEAVKVPTEWGRGSNIYPAHLDGQHLLHCLNTLRKFSYFSYYHEPTYGPGSNTLNIPPMLQMHHTHCLYMLLQALRCQPSMNVNTFHFQEGEKHPWSDFRTKRRCVNHEAILEWQNEENWITVDMLDLIKPGKDSKVIPAPEELRKAQADEVAH